MAHWSKRWADAWPDLLTKGRRQQPGGIGREWLEVCNSRNVVHSALLWLDCFAVHVVRIMIYDSMIVTT